MTQLKELARDFIFDLLEKHIRANEPTSWKNPLCGFIEAVKRNFASISKQFEEIWQYVRDLSKSLERMSDKIRVMRMSHKFLRQWVGDIESKQNSDRLELDHIRKRMNEHLWACPGAVSITAPEESEANNAPNN